MKTDERTSAYSKDENGKSETRICNRCRRLFQYLGFGHLYCPVCKIVDDEDFAKVKEYIYSHGLATAQEVEKNTQVSMRHIDRYLREGRLEIPDSSPIFIHCFKCKTNIKSGRFCADCASQLTHAMRKELDFDDDQIGDKPKEKPQNTERMRFLDKN